MATTLDLWSTGPEHLVLEAIVPYHELTANGVSVMDSTLSYRKTILCVCRLSQTRDKETAYDRSNVLLGGGQHDTCRLLDVHGGKVIHSLGVFRGT